MRALSTTIKWQFIVLFNVIKKLLRNNCMFILCRLRVCVREYVSKMLKLQAAWEEGGKRWKAKVFLIVPLIYLFSHEIHTRTAWWEHNVPFNRHHTKNIWIETQAHVRWHSSSRWRRAFFCVNLFIFRPLPFAMKTARSCSFELFISNNVTANRISPDTGVLLCN